MTKSSTTYLNSGTSITTYKALSGVISAQANAVMTRNSDTGQVNFTTISTMPGSGVRDFEVFKFGDALQATAPIFVRLDYTGVASGNHTINVTVGTTTDGAGTIGGYTSGSAAPTMFFTPTSNATRYCYASSDGSYFMLIFNATGAAGTGTDGICGFVIERTRDLDGTANGNGFNLWRWVSTADVGVAATNYFAATHTRVFDSGVNGNTPYLTYDANVFVPNAFNLTTGLYQSVAYAYPAYTMTTGPQGASKALMLAFQADYPRQSAVTLSHYGTTMTFMPMGPSATMNVPTMSAATTAAVKTGFSPLFRFE